MRYEKFIASGSIGMFVVGDVVPVKVLKGTGPLVCLLEAERLLSNKI